MSAVTLSLLFCSTSARALEPIELLGKNVFFDDSLSTPNHKQACASCHDAAKGGVLPDSRINATTVVAPGAAPHALGNIKPPTNAYAAFSPPFKNAPAGPFVRPWQGGNFWDGRAEGCGKSAAVPNPPCPIGNGGVSETITWSDLPVQFQNTGAAGYVRFLGPAADQALNPFPNEVEQNTREKAVCQQVKTAKYKALYQQAFGEPINCNTQGDPAPYEISYRRIAVAAAAWQASDDLSSFSSRRDTDIRNGDHFPLPSLTDEENLGHDIFYGLNATGKNRLLDNGRPLNASCAICHDGVPPGKSADPTGEALHQLYADSRFHNIGTPFNRDIPGVAKGAKTGLAAHVTSEQPGFFKTTTLRNVAKGANASFTKAYAHNGYFKSLKQIVHFYNTRDVLDKCEFKDIVDATAAEAMAEQLLAGAGVPEYSCSRHRRRSRFDRGRGGCARRLYGGAVGRAYSDPALGVQMARVGGVPPRGLLAEHGVEDDEQLAHAGRERDLGRASRPAQAPVEAGDETGWQRDGGRRWPCRGSRGPRAGRPRGASPAHLPAVAADGATPTSAATFGG